MALLSRGLLLRVVPADFTWRAAVSGVGWLWLRCFADLASNLARALRTTLIVFRGSLPLRSDCSFSIDLLVIELCEKLLEHTDTLWILRREHYGGVLCSRESQYLVHPGVRRILRDGLTLRLSPGLLAVRDGRGCLGAVSDAPLEAGAHANFPAGKTNKLARSTQKSKQTLPCATADHFQTIAAPTTPRRSWYRAEPCWTNARCGYR
jgi:hypothetical protein